MAGVAADPIVDLGLVRNPCPVVGSVLGFDAAADCYVAWENEAANGAAAAATTLALGAAGGAFIGLATCGS